MNSIIKLILNVLDNHILNQHIFSNHSHKWKSYDQYTKDWRFVFKSSYIENKLIDHYIMIDSFWLKHLLLKYYQIYSTN